MNKEKVIKTNIPDVEYKAYLASVIFYAEKAMNGEDTFSKIMSHLVTAANKRFPNETVIFREVEKIKK